MTKGHFRAACTVCTSYDSRSHPNLVGWVTCAHCVIHTIQFTLRFQNWRSLFTLLTFFLDVPDCNLLWWNTPWTKLLGAKLSFFKLAYLLTLQMSKWWNSTRSNIVGTSLWGGQWGSHISVRGSKQVLRALVTMARDRGATLDSSETVTNIVANWTKWIIVPSRLSIQTGGLATRMHLKMKDALWILSRPLKTSIWIFPKFKTEDEQLNGMQPTRKARAASSKRESLHRNQNGNDISLCGSNYRTPMSPPLSKTEEQLNCYSSSGITSEITSASALLELKIKNLYAWKVIAKNLVIMRFFSLIKHGNRSTIESFG